MGDDDTPISPQFIHVKRLRGSDDASHLFAQVHVAKNLAAYLPRLVDLSQ